MAKIYHGLGSTLGACHGAATADGLWCHHLKPSAPGRPWPCPWGTLPPMPSINWPVHPWPWAPPPKPAAALHPDSNTKPWSCFPLINFCPLVFDSISCFQSTLNILLDRFRLGSEYKNKDVMKQLGTKSSCYIFNWLIIVYIFLSLALSSFCYICSIHTHTPFITPCLNYSTRK